MPEFEDIVSYGRREYLTLVAPTMYTTGRFIDLKTHGVVSLDAVSFVRKGHIADLPLQDLIPVISYTGSSSGSDPEIFIRNQSHEIIPAWTLLPAENAAPPANGIKCFNDGFQAEMSLAVGHPCHETLTGCIRTALQCIKQALPLGAYLSPDDVVEVPVEALANADDIHVKLGCAPSLNAYGMEPEKLKEVVGRLLPIRFSGCHFHLSLRPLGSGLPTWWPEGVIVAIDKIAGPLLTALCRGLENPTRRLFYGLPGEYRLPANRPTGDGRWGRLEYRTPSGVLMRSPTSFIFAADIVRAAAKIGTLVDGRKLDWPDVTGLIMRCDADAACQLIRDMKPFYAALLRRLYYSANVDKMFETLMLGMKASPYLLHGSVARNWNLDTYCDPGTFSDLSSLWWGHSHL